MKQKHRESSWVKYVNSSLFIVYLYDDCNPVHS